ncbi:unnamed protein product [Parascedosporium putredinis]|uniref:HECT-type E3 ubiquitin transferase n=1 Tax=Parascedosporium putredinis TaxID=1442378 RepID=A0A9P1M9A4_9PEZI|nr:unnamed protein product [Parascedosporium putredinis]CAI7990453.1 unnamed protein product [Parascedosporium putredinis]
MGPWPVRRDSHAAGEAAVAAGTSSVLPPEALRSHAQQRPVKFADHPYDPNSSESDFHPSKSRKPQRRPQHSRSLSNPFPSFFTGNKKKKVDDQEDETSSPGDEEEDNSAPRYSKEKSRRPSHRSQHGHNPSKDFASGYCMTCGSKTSWPKELQTFRCTVCITINDLVPRPPPEVREGPTGWPRASAFSGGQLSPTSPSIPTPPLQDSASSSTLSPAKPISTCHTKLLVRQCLYSFLKSAFEDADKRRHTFDLNPFHGGDMKLPAVEPPQKSGTPDSHSPEPATYGTPCTSISRLLPTNVFDESLLTPVRSGSQGPTDLRSRESAPTEPAIAQLDPKMLLVGDIAENGAWWSGGQDGYFVRRAASQRQEISRSRVSHRSPHLDWEDLQDWYNTVISAAEGWRSAYDNLISEKPEEWQCLFSEQKLRDLEIQLLTAQVHVQRVLLKSTDDLLKRPGRPISEPDSLRFLLIILQNPLLYPNPRVFRGWLQSPNSESAIAHGPRSSPPRAGLPRNHFKQIKDLVSGFLTYRLLRQFSAKPETKIDITNGLVPSLESGHRTAAVLHAAIGDGAAPTTKVPTAWTMSRDDWQVRAAARVMAFLFAANNLPILPTSDFYVSLADSADLVADLKIIAAKIRVMEHEAKRQMLTKARDAFFDSILNRKNVNQYWILRIRRDCLVEDSLTGVSEIIGSGSEDIKKSLRIAFSGEEGIDHGGLRKEWFLLLIREVFNLDNGMFVYDEESGYCYFNPHSFETSDQFFLIGVVMGLAIYNSTILDIPLPPFTFRKLLATGPAPAPGSAAHPRPLLSYGLADLAEFRPRLAKGLQQLLDYDGDVESTFGLDFAIGMEKQFEPFKRGFFTVCGGNALSMFRPEEIELLVRGSAEALNVDALKSVAEYEDWGTEQPAESEPAVGWFWQTLAEAAPADQRKLLSFITGSDRIPAMGASSVKIKVGCLGEDCDRFPIARTCFNKIVLYRYGSREKLEKMVWTAVYESEGFGLR